HVAQPVHERHVRVVQVRRRRLDRVVEQGRLAVDQRIGKQPLGRVMLEPRLAEAARVLRLDDALGVGGQLDVIAHAAAARAGGVVYDGEVHWVRSAEAFALRVRLRNAELVEHAWFDKLTMSGFDKLTMSGFDKLTMNAHPEAVEGCGLSGHRGFSRPPEPGG